MAGLTNISFYNAQRSMATAQAGLAQTTQRLSTGMRINSSKDDAAGLAIAERMSSQNRGMAVAVRNANDAISLSQTAEGAFGNVADALQRMRELAVQARNATNSDTDKDALDQEFGQLAQEVQRIFTGTTFNGKSVVGADAGAQVYQIGAGTAAADSITITTKNMTTDADITAVAGTDLAGAGRATIDNTADATAIGTVLDDIDAALASVNTERAGYGAIQNRFDSVIKNLSTSMEATTASRGRIMDTDFATETANLAKYQLLQQASASMLAQSNQQGSWILKLLA
jgi:flagellin